MKRLILAVGAVAWFALALPLAQMRVVPVDEERGHVALGLLLRHLGNTGIFMQATAHPDDEDNALLVMLNRGQGYRTALATATRGNGGQNEIGPEIFEALGVLRTEELAAMHRFDGAEQYFTRAVDFGYSFSIEETLEKWGRDEITGDFVRLIRTIRPDVMTGLNPEAIGGGLHHPTSSILARDAYKLAGDPTKYPEHLRDGLRPWQPKKFYDAAGFGPAAGAQSDAGRLLTIDLAGFDQLLGRTYSEIGTEARSMHKCQMMSQLLALPGPSTRGYRLTETTIPGETERGGRSLFDSLDTTIGGLAQFAGARPPRELTDGLGSIASAVQSAQKQFDGSTDEGTLQPLLTGLRAVRALRAALRSMPIDDQGRFEIDFRLSQKEREFQQAVLVANGVRVEALADDGVVVPGQSVRVSVIVANRGAADINVKQVRFEGFDGGAACVLTAAVGGRGPGGPGGPGGPAGTAAGRGRGRGDAPAARPEVLSGLKKDQAGRCDPILQVPINARVSEPYWHRAGEAGRYTFDPDAPFGLPYRPTPFTVQVTLGLGGANGGDEVIDALPVQYRYETDVLSGEKRSDLLVVPAYSVRVSPEVAIIPVELLPPVQSARVDSASRGQVRGPEPAATEAAAAGGGRGRGAAPLARARRREIRVTVVNDSKGAVENAVTLELPPGWRSSPSSQEVAFTREDEARTVRFDVIPPASAAPGDYHVKAVVRSGADAFARGYQVIEYPHIRRQHIYRDADVVVKISNVKIAPGLRVGYIMGSGDDVPAALEQLGASVTVLQPDDLAWGDLSGFNTIVTGIRAYERRSDLRANNSRLIEYVRNGGTMIVQYNREPFNAAQYGPYPARVTADRITDEHAAVKVLDPSNPIFTIPNRITDSAWSGWVQERGIQFLSEHDPRYRDLVEMEDPFPNNKGAKRGSLVEATYGRGRWVYVGLGLWRELPAGVDGAYQLMANLVSLGKLR
jgi:LmbE family N-acetylglucosaminyl deacetylase